MKELDLIKELKKNSYSAQMQVYNLYKNSLYNTSLRFFKNREDAEDAVQDAFIKGFQKVSQLEDNANLGAWLRKIVINHSLDIIRKRKYVWVDDIETMAIEEEEDDFNENENISIDFIKECMDTLDEKYRVILILYMIEDYNHREISELLQLKESTVRNQYIRGKSKLLKLIQKNKEHEFKETHTK